MSSLYVSLWFAYGLLMTSLWFAYGFFMVSLWFLYASASGEGTRQYRSPFAAA